MICALVGGGGKDTDGCDEADVETSEYVVQQQ